MKHFIFLVFCLAQSISSATEFSLANDECIIVVASTKTQAEGAEIQQKYPGSKLYSSKSGYIAIGVEKIAKQSSGERIKELLSAGKIPKDSNCAGPNRIISLLTTNESAQVKEDHSNNLSDAEPTLESTETKKFATSRKSESVHYPKDQLTTDSDAETTLESTKAKKSSKSNWTIMEYLGIAYVLICLILYFLPALIALLRSHQNFVPILLLNLFLGWTVLGWIVALVWSFTALSPSKIYVSVKKDDF
jgi:hypothetical protein